MEKYFLKPLQDLEIQNCERPLQGIDGFLKKIFVIAKLKSRS